MRRETVNRMRYVLEDMVPAFLRDSFLCRALFKTAYGAHIDRLADFRQRAPFLTEDEYRNLYAVHPRIQDETDNSEACILAIENAVMGNSICDVGCGTGYLLRCLQRKHPQATLTGVDIILSPEQKSARDIRYVETKIEKLPFDDAAFDTVICTHTLEHILDIRAAIAELRRITGKRLIIVVPQEREYIYTFNPHFHFFPYAHSFLRAMIPVPKNYKIEKIGRDFFYTETRN